MEIICLASMPNKSILLLLLPPKLFSTTMNTNLQNPIHAYEYDEANPHFRPRQQQPGFPAEYDEPAAMGRSRIQPRHRRDQSQLPPAPVPPPQRPQDLYGQNELAPPPPPPRKQPPMTAQPPMPAVTEPRPPPPPPRRAQNANQNLMYPLPSRTKPITWFAAVFCVILWIVIILGGLLVLIIYLVYRPRNPHLQIMSATLNAAYLDMGYLLNADLTLLANFTNPSNKVRVDFNYVILQLYYQNQLIANQYVESFSAMRGETKLASIEMVSSQVRLPVKVCQQLMVQIQNNTVPFDVDGLIHARSNFGSVFRYSYWLYTHCNIMLTAPPTGIMIASKCKTKR
ncbi:hypothetical protein Dimus_015175 [Dionaea muscipula]